MGTSWPDREGPLLRAIVRQLEAEGRGVDPRKAADAIEMSHEDADRAVNRLYRAGMLDALPGDDRVLSVHDVTEKGLQAAGEWPSEAELLADHILAVLAERAANEPDPVKRSKFEAGLRGFGTMTRDLTVEVAGAALAKSLGTG